MVVDGTVTSVSPLLVRLDSSATAIPARLPSGYNMPFSVPPASSYTYTAPVVGDRVAVALYADGRLLILGKVA